MRVSSPMEQFFPVYPATQSQWKSFTPSVQYPSFWHGCSAQSSMSEFNKEQERKLGTDAWL